MKKRSFALIFAVVMILTSLTACKAKSEYGKIYVDTKEESHVLVTEKNGEYAQNENNDLYEVKFDETGKVKKDENGQPVTAVYKFPGFMEIKEPKFKMFPIIFYDHYVRNSAMKLLLPKGFEQTGQLNLIIENKKLGVKIDFLARKDTTYEETYTNIQKSLQIMKESSDEIEIKEDNLTLCGETAYKCIITNNADKNILTTYCFEKNDTLIRVHSVIGFENKDAVDVEAIINTAIFY